MKLTICFVVVLLAIFAAYNAEIIEQNNDNKIENSKIENDVLLFLLVGTVSFLFDFCSLKHVYIHCKQNIFTVFTLFVHHLIAVFMYFGWMSKTKQMLKLHILAFFIVFCVQNINLGTCPLTVYVNQKCNLPTHHYMRDVLYFTNFKHFHLYTMFMTFSFAMSVYKLSIFPKAD